MPQIMKDIVDWTLYVFHHRSACRIVDVPVRLIREDGLQLFLERVQNRTVEQIVDLAAPLLLAKILEIIQLVPLDRTVCGACLERVLNRVAYREKVFTVKLRHHRDDQACSVDTVGFIKGLDKHNLPRSGDVMVPASQIQEQIVDVGGSGIVCEIPERKMWSGSRIQHCLLEHDMELLKIYAQKRVQRRFSEVQDFVVVSEDSRFLPNALLRGWPGLMPSWHRCPWMRRRRRRRRSWRRRSQKCSLRASKASSVPDGSVRRGSRCHYGNRCTFAHAFHELADEGWYVQGSTADW